MHITILHNRDHDLLEEDPGREAREDVIKVASALADALNHEGNVAEPVAVTGNKLDFLSVLERRRPDLVVNLCESLNADARGEMAIPCLLDLMGIPFTGSGALSLGLALHKNKAKELLRARGVSSPEFAVVERVEDLARVEVPFPAIVKPAREDASIGIDFDSVVHDRTQLARAVLHVMQTFAQPALVERYIAGREIYVPLLGNRPRGHLPLTEITFGAAFIGKPHIVSYKAKWEPDSPECKDSRSSRCEIDPVTEARLVKTATAAFDALDCRDYGRVDLRLSDEGEPFVIDINPNCDLHPDAGFAKAARAAGMDYRALATRLVEIALERTHGVGHPLRQSERSAAVGGAARKN